MYGRKMRYNYIDIDMGIDIHTCTHTNTHTHTHTRTTCVYLFVLYCMYMYIMYIFRLLLRASCIMYMCMWNVHVQTHAYDRILSCLCMSRYGSYTSMQHNA